MANPLFAPQPPEPSKPTPPPSDHLWIDPVESAFSVTVEAGWTQEGGLKRFDRGFKYAVFTLTSPDGAIVFWGDPDLPLRYFVPGPWHKGMGLVPGKRTYFGEGASLESMFPSFYVPADRHWYSLVNRRFGICIPGVAKPVPSQVESVRASGAQIGAPYKRIDACVADFTSADRLHQGRIQLATFGGDQPGDTWQVEFITGFYGPVATSEATERAYQKAIKTLSTDPMWIAKQKDGVEEGRRIAHATAMKLREQDLKDTEREKQARERDDDIRKRAVDDVNRRHPN